MASKNTALIVTGDKQIDKKLAKLEGKVQKKVLRKSMRVGMKDILKTVRDRFPKETGKTAKSIKIKSKTKKGKIMMDVKSSDDNHIAKFLEFGTSKMPAQPTFRPVFEEKGESARQKTRAEILQGIEEITKS